MSLNEENLRRLQTNNPLTQLGSRAMSVVSNTSASRQEKLDAVRGFATASLNSESKELLGAMAAALYLVALRAPDTESGSGSGSASASCREAGSGSGSAGVDETSMTPQYVAEDLYGPGQGQNEETVEMVTRLFIDLGTYLSSDPASTQGQQ
ncbi:hypothetical protein JCM24511_03242 [Saitozyma sp. JCM 24511]|nr:hypothetical protein JCM24511_03242 [Saitozyma sp. JCM 24511]